MSHYKEPPQGMHLPKEPDPSNVHSLEEARQLIHFYADAHDGYKALTALLMASPTLPETRDQNNGRDPFLPHETDPEFDISYIVLGACECSNSAGNGLAKIVPSVELLYGRGLPTKETIIEILSQRERLPHRFLEGLRH
ncbi:MAG: hypothetical protein ABII01_05305 [Candidatus Woesearchaeota archaeon]